MPRGQEGVVEKRGFCHVKIQGGCEAEDLKKMMVWNRL
jgi:hypothetical protein